MQAQEPPALMLPFWMAPEPSPERPAQSMQPNANPRPEVHARSPPRKRLEKREREVLRSRGSSAGGRSPQRKGRRGAARRRSTSAQRNDLGAQRSAPAAGRATRGDNGSGGGPSGIGGGAFGSGGGGAFGRGTGGAFGGAKGGGGGARSVYKRAGAQHAAGAAPGALHAPRLQMLGAHKTSTAGTAVTAAEAAWKKMQAFERSAAASPGNLAQGNTFVQTPFLAGGNGSKPQGAAMSAGTAADIEAAGAISVARGHTVKFNGGVQTVSDGSTAAAAAAGGLAASDGSMASAMTMGEVATSAGTARGACGNGGASDINESGDHLDVDDQMALECAEGGDNERPSPDCNKPVNDSVMSSFDMLSARLDANSAACASQPDHTLLTRHSMSFMCRHDRSDRTMPANRKPNVQTCSDFFVLVQNAGPPEDLNLHATAVVVH